MCCHANGYVYTSVLQEPAASIFRVEVHHWRWKEQFCLKCCYSCTQLDFAEKKNHNFETDACHLVISHTLTLTNITYHSISHSCCDTSFIPFIISPSNTCDIRKQPYLSLCLSPWIIYRLSECPLSSCPCLTVQCTVHVSSSLFLNGSWG